MRAFDEEWSAVAMTLAGNERTLMESLWRFMARDYARTLSGDDVARVTGLEGGALAHAVRELASRPHPYVEATFQPERPDRLVELRLTVDGQMYCRARD